MLAGQAQKEFSINQALSVIDTLLSASVSATLSTPPANPVEGESYRIGASATDEWTSHEDKVAIWLGGAWQFLQPHAGFTIFDQTDGSLWHYNSAWKTAIEPAAPTGGSIVDTEARLVISELIQALRNLGIFPDPT